MKKKKTIQPETQQIPVGLFCRLLRPNVWTGHTCRVERYAEGFHVVRVLAVDRPSFEARAKFEELEKL